MREATVVLFPRPPFPDPSVDAIAAGMITLSEIKKRKEEETVFMRPPIIGVAARHWTEIDGLPVIGCRLPYLKAIENAGGVPFIFPLPAHVEDLRGLFEVCNGILLTGGEDVAPEYYGESPHAKLGAVTRDRDEVELHLIRWALAEHKPILGICRGCQALNVAAGGSLFQDIPSQVENALPHTHPEKSWHALQHEISVDPSSVLGKALGVASLSTNSLHHQSVKVVAPNFTVSARAADGVVEGIEHSGERFVVGVQCHPETLWETVDVRWQGLFREFVQAAREFGSTVPLHYVPLVPYSEETFKAR